jgi:hypothetical protein
MAKHKAKPKKSAKKRPVAGAKKKNPKRKVAGRKVSTKRGAARKAAKEKSGVKKPVARKAAAKKQKRTKPPKKKPAEKAKPKTQRSKPSAKKPRGGSGAAVSDAFEAMIAPHPPQIRALARRLRELVYEILPRAREEFFAGGRMALYSDPTEICGIQPHLDANPDQARCNFYLRHGALSPAPVGFLEGVGQGIRHVKVYSIDDLAMKIDDLRRLILDGKRLARV